MGARRPRLFHLLHRAHRSAFGAANRAAQQRYGLSVAQIVALFAAASPDGVRIGTMARRLDLDAGAATRSVERLEARRWATRRPDPKDGRAKRVHLTKKGFAKLVEAKGALAEANAKLVEGFTEDEIAVVVRFLEHAASLESVDG